MRLFASLSALSLLALRASTTPLPNTDLTGGHAVHPDSVARLSEGLAACDQVKDAEGSWRGWGSRYDDCLNEVLYLTAVAACGQWKDAEGAWRTPGSLYQVCFTKVAHV